MSLLARWMAVVEYVALGGDGLDGDLGESGAAGTEFRAGTRLAASGAVSDLEVTPGLIEGNVDHRDRIHATIGVSPLGEKYWSEVAQRIEAHPSWKIQLDAHLVPDELAVELIPDAAALTPTCSCGVWSRWCRHTVAVAASFGDSLASDPFGAVTALGASRDVVLGTRAVSGVLPYGLDAGISAPAAYRKTPAEAPRVPPVVAEQRTPSAFSVPAPAGSGISAPHLLDAREDAARRAHDFLTGADAELYLTIPVGLDVIRRAASGDVEAISAETNLDPNQLRAAAAAWRVGGAAAVRALRDRWECPPERLGDARSWLGEDAKVRANTVSTASDQLRLDRQGQWWRLGQDHESGWMIVAGPAPSVADVMALHVAPGHEDGQPQPEGETATSE